MLYTLYGVLFGVLFPLLAWTFAFHSESLPFTQANLSLVHSKHVMLYMIDTAPFFLGLVAHIAGRHKNATDKYRNQLESLIEHLEDLVTERTTELERSNESLQKSYLQASAFASAQSTFLANMSHEIRTPMNAIVGMAFIAKKHFGNPDQEQKVYNSIQQILDSSHHLLGLINNILDLSKIEAGEFSLGSDNFCFKDLVEESIQIIMPRCAEKNIILDTNIASTADLWVNSDKLRIMQVLINLIGNAVKFTKNGGTITLEITLKERIGSKLSLFFAVHDTGIGMSQETLNFLFTPFKQADDQVVRKSGGTGLGLAISQNIVALLGSKIEVKSELGFGSSFFFTIVVEEGSFAAPDAYNDLSNLSFEGKKILLVDDIEINCIIVAELLEDTKVTIEIASDGQLALDKFTNSSPNYYNLILMDVQMPNMDGYTATQKIRELERPDARTIPIIAMTANAMKEDADRARASGMNDHVSKPVELMALLAVLQSQFTSSDAKKS